MKFSIITPCYNSGSYIEATIRSISEQTYRDFEHIVVDGGSKDDTIEILGRHPQIRWISEKDRGQSDAINKGFRMASGDIFAWQNADDLYLPDAFSTVAEFFREHTEVGLVYGYYQQVGPDGAWICDVRPMDWNRWLFAHGRFAPVQPTVFWRRQVQESVGELDLSLNYCMDIDFYCRAAKLFPFARIPRILGQFRMHMDSKTANSANRGKIRREYKQVLSRHYDYNPLDSALFEAFYYRSRLAEKLKQRLFKRF